MKILKLVDSICSMALDGNVIYEILWIISSKPCLSNNFMRKLFCRCLSRYRVQGGRGGGKTRELRKRKSFWWNIIEIMMLILNLIKTWSFQNITAGWREWMNEHIVEGGWVWGWSWMENLFILKFSSLSRYYIFTYIFTKQHRSRVRTKLAKFQFINRVFDAENMPFNQIQ